MHPIRADRQFSSFDHVEHLFCSDNINKDPYWGDCQPLSDKDHANPLSDGEDELPPLFLDPIDLGRYSPFASASQLTPHYLDSPSASSPLSAEEIPSNQNMHTPTIPATDYYPDKVSWAVIDRVYGLYLYFLRKIPVEAPFEVDKERWHSFQSNSHCLLDAFVIHSNTFGFKVPDLFDAYVYAKASGQKDFDKINNFNVRNRWWRSKNSILRHFTRKLDISSICIKINIPFFDLTSTKLTTLTPENKLWIPKIFKIYYRIFLTTFLGCHRSEIGSIVTEAKKNLPFKFPDGLPHTPEVQESLLKSIEEKCHRKWRQKIGEPYGFIKLMFGSQIINTSVTSPGDTHKTSKRMSPPHKSPFTPTSPSSSSPFQKRLRRADGSPEVVGFQDTPLNDSARESLISSGASSQVEILEKSDLSSYITYGIFARIYALKMLFKQELPVIPPHFVSEIQWSQLKTVASVRSLVTFAGITRTGVISVKMSNLFDSVVVHNIRMGIVPPPFFDVGGGDPLYHDWEQRRKWWEQVPLFGRNIENFVSGSESGLDDRVILRRIALPLKLLENRHVEQILDSTLRENEIVEIVGKLFEAVTQQLLPTDIPELLYFGTEHPQFQKRKFTLMSGLPNTENVSSYLLYHVINDLVHEWESPDASQSAIDVV